MFARGLLLHMNALILKLSEASSTKQGWMAINLPLYVLNLKSHLFLKKVADLFSI